MLPIAYRKVHRNIIPSNKLKSNVTINKSVNVDNKNNKISNNPSNSIRIENETRIHLNSSQKKTFAILFEFHVY